MPSRRTDAKLSERAEQLLLGKNFANVATIRADGTPHVTPVWVDYDGEHVLLNTVVGHAKERHLRRDPRVTVLVLDQQNPYSYVAVTGVAELTTEGAEEHIGKLSMKYFGVPMFGNRDYSEERILVKVRLDRVDDQTH
jgi:PPOX class probable F420-dependent enzyme